MSKEVTDHLIDMTTDELNKTNELFDSIQKWIRAIIRHRELHQIEH